MGFKMGLALTQEGLNNVSAWSARPRGSAVAAPAPGKHLSAQVPVWRDKAHSGWWP